MGRLELDLPGRPLRLVGIRVSKIEAEPDGDLAYYIKQHEPLSFAAYYSAPINVNSDRGPDDCFQVDNSLLRDGSPNSDSSHDSSCSSWVGQVEAEAVR